MSEMVDIEVDTVHVPDPLKTDYGKIWVVWSPAVGKMPLAPWDTGHMYPSDWAEEKVDPRVSYDRARSVADLPVEEIEQSWPFPPDTNPDYVLPAVCLPPAEVDLLFLDLDDVIIDRQITREAWDILQRLGGYAEVSQSWLAGDRVCGAHAWVEGDLPGGRKKIIEELDGRGQLELYSNQGRMTGGTWRHLAGTPLDSVPDAQNTIEELVDDYADIDAEPAHPDDGARARTTSQDALGSTPTETNPYFDLNLKRAADTGPFARCRTVGETLAAGEWQGPHPAHGATSDQPDVESTNFRIEGGQWVCYAHGTGGGVLQLIAVLESQIDIDCRDCGNKRRTGEIYQDLRKFLKTCLAARDEYAGGALDGEDPPYRALVAVADLADLGFRDKEEQILGSASYNVAKRIYTDLSLGDV